MKKFIVMMLVLLFATPVFAGNPCEDALAKYSKKLPNFSCGTKEKNDVIQDRLVTMFRELAAKRKAEGYTPPKPKPVEVVEPKEVETKVSQKQGYVLEFKNDFKVDW